MAQAIFGLVGVIIGGLITGGLGLLRDHRQASAELRAGLRLFDDDLQGVIVSAERAIADRTWVRNMESLSVREWDRSRATFASRLGLHDWLEFTGAVLAVEKIALTVQVLRLRTEDSGAPKDRFEMTESQRDELVELVQHLRRTRAICETMHSPLPNTLGLALWVRRQRKRKKELSWRQR